MYMTSKLIFIVHKFSLKLGPIELRAISEFTEHGWRASGGSHFGFLRGWLYFFYKYIYFPWLDCKNNIFHVSLFISVFI